MRGSPNYLFAIWVEAAALFSGDPIRRSADRISAIEIRPPRRGNVDVRAAKVLAGNDDISACVDLNHSKRSQAALRAKCHTWECMQFSGRLRFAASGAALRSPADCVFHFFVQAAMVFPDDPILHPT